MTGSLRFRYGTAGAVLAKWEFLPTKIAGCRVDQFVEQNLKRNERHAGIAVCIGATTRGVLCVLAVRHDIPTP